MFSNPLLTGFKGRVMILHLEPGVRRPETGVTQLTGGAGVSSVASLTSVTSHFMHKNNNNNNISVVHPVCSLLLSCFLDTANKPAHVAQNVVKNTFSSLDSSFKVQRSLLFER